MSFSQPVGGSHTQSKNLAFVDHAETYGEHIIREYLNQLDSLGHILPALIDE